MMDNKPETVDEYIARFPSDIRIRLEQVRTCIRDVPPNAGEDLKWSQPAYSEGTILVSSAGYKNHIGFYPTPSVIQAFKERLVEYKTGKGSVQFPYSQELPLELIAYMVRDRGQDYRDNGTAWM